jgi:PBP1b-binding outer membrane lipoprotein LpoB
MKKIIHTAAFLAAIIFSSCSGTKTDENANDSADLNALVTPGGSNIPVIPENMDSKLNYVDKDGKRQGKWIIYGKMQDDKAFNPAAKVEEGEYKDNLKEGEWTLYNPDETVKGTVKFSAGKEVK